MHVRVGHYTPHVKLFYAHSVLTFLLAFYTTRSFLRLIDCSGGCCCCCLERRCLCGRQKKGVSAERSSSKQARLFLRPSVLLFSVSSHFFLPLWSAAAVAAEQTVALLTLTTRLKDAGWVLSGWVAGYPAAAWWRNVNIRSAKHIWRTDVKQDGEWLIGAKINESEQHKKPFEVCHHCSIFPMPKWHI